MEETYYEVSDEFANIFESIWKTTYLPVDLKYRLVGNAKLKNGVKIIKLNDLQCYLTQQELIIEVNEIELNKLDEKAMMIILNQEVCKITVDMNNGKIKLIKPDVVTFSGVIKKYGLDDVMRANELIKLLDISDNEEEVIQTINGFEKDVDFK